MPRRKVYPRFKGLDGREYLLVGALSLTDVPTSDGVEPAKLYRRLKELVVGIQSAFLVESRRELYAFPVPSGWALCIEDNHQNVMDFKWLEKKASKLSSGIIKLMVREQVVT